MRNLKKHIIMVSAAAMFAAAGFAGNSVFAAEPTTDNFVLPPQMTEQQKADWAKDNPQYREKETQQAERTARMAPKAVRMKSPIPAAITVSLSLMQKKAALQEATRMP